MWRVQQYLDSGGRGEGLPVLEPLDLGVGHTDYARLDTAAAPHHHEGLVGTAQELGVFGDLELHSLPSYAVLVSRYRFVHTDVPLQHSVSESHSYKEVAFFWFW